MWKAACSENRPGVIQHKDQCTVADCAQVFVKERPNLKIQKPIRAVETNVV